MATTTRFNPRLVNERPGRTDVDDPCGVEMVAGLIVICASVHTSKVDPSYGKS